MPPRRAWHRRTMGKVNKDNGLLLPPYLMNQPQLCLAPPPPSRQPPIFVSESTPSPPIGSADNINTNTPTHNYQEAIADEHATPQAEFVSLSFLSAVSHRADLLSQRLEFHRLHNFPLGYTWREGPFVSTVRASELSPRWQRSGG